MQYKNSPTQAETQTTKTETQRGSITNKHRKTVYRQQLDEALISLEAVEDLDKRTDILVAAISSSIEEVLPVEERIRNKWISKEVKQKLKLQRDQSASAEAEYRRKCSEVRKAAREDKQKWMEDKCNDIQKYHAEYRTREVYKLKT